MLRPVLLALLLTGTATHAFAQPPAETVPLLREIKNWVTGRDNLRNCHALSVCAMANVCNCRAMSRRVCR